MGLVPTIEAGAPVLHGPIPLSTERRLSERTLEKGCRKFDWFLTKVKEVSGAERALHHDLEKVAMDLRSRREGAFVPNVIAEVNGRRVVRTIPRMKAWAEGQFLRLRRHGRRIRGNSEVEALVQREGPGLLLMENLHDAEYVHLIYRARARQGERFVQFKEGTLAAARTFTGLSAGSPIASNR